VATHFINNKEIVMSISDSVIEKAIQEMSQEFDSHEVILKIAQDNQRIYVQALTETDGDRPFQLLHSILGRRIKEICNRYEYKSCDHRSKDIFGQHSKCILWLKNDR